MKINEVKMAKTADGKFNLRKIVKAAGLLPGVVIEAGNRHKYVLKFKLAPVGNCALDTSTHVDAHLIPWFKKVTGYNKQGIYHAFRKGAWAS